MLNDESNDLIGLEQIDKMTPVSDFEIEKKILSYFKKNISQIV